MKAIFSPYFHNARDMKAGKNSKKIKQNELHSKERKNKVGKGWRKDENLGSNRKRVCRSAIRRFLQNSSLYALNRIGNSPNTILKVFWATILFVCSAGCIFHVAQILASYYEYPVTTSFETISSSGNEELFPAITICNINVLQRVFETSAFKNLNYEKCLNFSHASDSEYVCKGTDKYEIPRSVTLMKLLAALDDESRLKFGHQAENFVKRCEFDTMRCGPEHFKRRFHLKYGNCFTFTSQERKRSIKIHPRHGGLELILNIELEKYSRYTPSAGIIAQVHNPHVPSDPDMGGFVVSPGFEVNVAVAKEVTTRLPSPYKSRCKTYEEDEDQTICKDDCFDKYVRQECSCSITGRKSQGFQNCNLANNSVLSCVKMEALPKFKATGDCGCSVPCRETTYHLQLSTLKWPSRAFYESLNFEDPKETVNLTYEAYRETHLKLRVYFNTFDYTLYKQKPKYLRSELFGQIGGQLGLWLGTSLILFFEVLESTIFWRRKLK